MKCDLDKKVAMMDRAKGKGTFEWKNIAALMQCGDIRVWALDHSQDIRRKGSYDAISR